MPLHGEQEASQKHQPTRQKSRIGKLIERKGAKTLSNLLKKFSSEEFKFMYAQIGSGYKEKASVLKKKKIQHNANSQTRGLLTALNKTVTHQPVQQNIDWLEYL